MDLPVNKALDMKLDTHINKGDTSASADLIHARPGEIAIPIPVYNQHQEVIT